MMAVRSTLTIVAFLSVGILGCDEASPSTPGHTATSIALPGVCGSIATNATGQLFAWGRPSQTSWHVDKLESDGTPVWRVTLPGRTDCKGAVTSSGDLLTGSNDTLYLLNGSSGVVRWKRQLTLGFVSGFAIAANGTVYVTLSEVGFTPASLLALNGSTGATLWTQTLHSSSAPYLSDPTSTLYVPRIRGFETYNPNTGDPGWTTVVFGASGTDVAIGANGDLILVTATAGTDSAFVDEYSPAGTHLWFNKAGNFRPTGSPVIDKTGTIYTSYTRTNGSSPGAVVAMDPASGQTLWKKDFHTVASDIVVDSSRTVFVIAQLSQDSANRLYGVRDGVIASTTIVEGIGVNESPRHLLLHPNGLLYYIGTDVIWFVPTAGIGTNPVWPMSKHDPLRTARKTLTFLPD